MSAVFGILKVVPLWMWFVLAMGVALGVQTTRLHWAQSSVAKAELQVEAARARIAEIGKTLTEQNSAIETLAQAHASALAEQAVAAKQAAKTAATIRSSVEALLAAKVPTECHAAVQWAAEEVRATNQLVRGTK
jgi:hypothetical protein